MLARFPDGSAELVGQIKDREHEGDRLTHYWPIEGIF